MPNALASLPSGRERRVSLATPAMASSMVSRRSCRRSRWSLRKGVSLTGFFGPPTGLPFGRAGASGSFFSAGLEAFAEALGALLAALAGAAFGFLAAFVFGCDFGMVTGVRTEKGGRDTQFGIGAQGGNRLMFSWSGRGNRRVGGNIQQAMSIRKGELALLCDSRRSAAG